VASNQTSVATAKGDARYSLHGWDYMIYAYLQQADDAGADRVGVQARDFRALDKPGFAEAFGGAAIPARLTLA
jgi:hypothetical protein